MDTHTSFNEVNEVIQYTEPNVTFIVDEASFGKGVLYIAESKLYWKNYINNQVVSVDYKSMCIFGTCNHPTVHDKPCIQILVDFTYQPSDSILSENGYIQNGTNHEEEIDGVDANEDDNDEDDEDEEGEIKSKIKLVPDNSECLAEIYEAITRVQPLHNTNDSDEEGDDFYYNENDEFEDYDEDDSEQILMN